MRFTRKKGDAVFRSMTEEDGAFPDRNPPSVVGGSSAQVPSPPPKRKSKFDNLKKLNCRSRSSHNRRVHLDNDSTSYVPQSTVSEGSSSVRSTGWDSEDDIIDPLGLTDDGLVLRQGQTFLNSSLVRLGTVEEGENEESTHCSESEHPSNTAAAAAAATSTLSPRVSIDPLASGTLSDDADGVNEQEDFDDENLFFQTAATGSTSSSNWALAPSPRDNNSNISRSNNHGFTSSSPGITIQPLSASISDTPSFLRDLSIGACSSEDSQTMHQFCDKSEESEYYDNNNNNNNDINNADVESPRSAVACLQEQDRQRQQRSRQRHLEEEPLEKDALTSKVTKAVVAAELSLMGPPPPPPDTPPPNRHRHHHQQHHQQVMSHARCEMDRYYDENKQQDSDEEDSTATPTDRMLALSTAHDLQRTESQTSGYEQDVEDFQNRQLQGRLKRSGTEQRPSRGNSPVERYTRSDASSNVVTAARDFLAYMEKTKKIETFAKTTGSPSSASRRKKALPRHHHSDTESDARNRSMERALAMQPADVGESSSEESGDGAGRLYDHLFMTGSKNKKTMDQHLAEHSVSSASALDTDEESPLQGIALAPSSSYLSEASQSIDSRQASSAASNTEPRKAGKLKGLISMFEDKNADNSRLNVSLSSSKSTASAAPPVCSTRPSPGSVVSFAVDDDSESRNMLDLPLDNRLSPTPFVHQTRVSSALRQDKAMRQSPPSPSSKVDGKEDAFWRSRPRDKEDSEGCFVPIKPETTKSPRDSRYPGWSTRKATGLPPFAPPVYQPANESEYEDGISDVDDSWDRFSMYSANDIDGYRVPGADEI